MPERYQITEIRIVRKPIFPACKNCLAVFPLIVDVFNDLKGRGKITIECTEKSLEPKTDVRVKVKGDARHLLSITNSTIQKCPGRVAKQKRVGL